MNERIFELAEQAYEETHRVMGSTCLQEAFDDFYTEKFAELFVQECGVALAPMLRDMISRGQAYDLIKKYFGVEE